MRATKRNSLSYVVIETNKVKKECYLIRQDNTHILDKITFFKYRKIQIEITETNKKVAWPIFSFLVMGSPDKTNVVLAHSSQTEYL